MTPEDKLDTELKALYNAYWQGLQIIKNSEYLEPEAEKDVAIWNGVMANWKKVADKAFSLEIAESRLFYIDKEKKL
jgi:hypothetical protein